MKKKNNKDLILIGNCITDFFTATLATLQVAFLLNDEAIYQAINLASCIIAAIINKLIISKGNTKKFYKHRNKLFMLESIVNLALVPVVLALNNKAMIVVGAVVIIMQPFNVIQSINNKVLISELYSKEARLQHDLIYSEKSSYIKIAALALGFFANKVIPANVAYAIALIVEAVNNIFYMRQKPLD